MPIKPSQALLAALALVAAPAFAQDTTGTATPDEPGTASQDAAPSEPAAEPAAAEDASDAAPAATAAEPADADAPAATAETQAEPATDAAPADAAPATGQPAQDQTAAEPQVGSYYVKSTHNDWSLRCINTDQNKDPCELYQLMKDAEGNSVAEMTLIPLTNGEVAAGATLVAPLETDLIRGLGFAVDSGQAREYPFSFCAPVGCVSRMGFTAAELNQLKRGGKATVTLMPFGGDPKNPVELNLSLAGFTAAFEELSEYTTQPAPQASAPDEPAADAPAEGAPAEDAAQAPE